MFEVEQVIFRLMVRQGLVLEFRCLMFSVFIVCCRCLVMVRVLFFLLLQSNMVNFFLFRCVVIFNGCCVFCWSMMLSWCRVVLLVGCLQWLLQVLKLLIFIRISVIFFFLWVFCFRVCWVSSLQQCWLIRLVRLFCLVIMFSSCWLRNCLCWVQFCRYRVNEQISIIRLLQSVFSRLVCRFFLLLKSRNIVRFRVRYSNVRCMQVQNVRLSGKNIVRIFRVVFNWVKCGILCYLNSMLQVSIVRLISSRQQGVMVLLILCRLGRKVVGQIISSRLIIFRCMFSSCLNRLGCRWMFIIIQLVMMNSVQIRNVILMVVCCCISEFQLRNL